MLKILLDSPWLTFVSPSTPVFLGRRYLSSGVVCIHQLGHRLVQLPVSYLHPLLRELHSDSQVDSQRSSRRHGKSRSWSMCFKAHNDFAQTGISFGCANLIVTVAAVHAFEVTAARTLGICLSSPGPFPQYRAESDEQTPRFSSVTASSTLSASTSCAI